MGGLVSNWFNTVKSVPADYICPPDIRLGNESVPLLGKIPVIDLSQDQNCVIQQIIRAGEDFGFFQVINHGVSEYVSDDAMNLFKEIFTMPVEEKKKMSITKHKEFKLDTSFSGDYDNEKVHAWRDRLRHGCQPLDEYIHSWPEKPARYRDVVAKFSTEVGKLGNKILELICEGYGLKPGYFEDELSHFHVISTGYYPQSPDPSLTLGLPDHVDPNLINLLFQDVYGLQILKDGQWLGVEPIPNAFVVSIGEQLQAISNGKLKSSRHRVVSSKETRTCINYAFHPRYDVIIQPAEVLVSETNPPLYQAYRYEEFLKRYVAKDFTGGLVDFKVQYY